jgi:hypothetical protein
MSDLNFLFDVPPKAEDLPKMEPGFVDDPRLSPLFIKPQRPEYRKTPVEDRSLNKPSKDLYRFGVIVEDFSSEIIGEVTRDLISLISSLPSTSRLVVVSPSSGDFWEKIASTLPIDLQLGNFDSVKVWKVYWKFTKPVPPSGVRYTFEKRVGNPGVKRIVLRPNLDSAPVPVNPDANRMLPAGQSPSFSRRPSMMGPVQTTPQLYLWSGCIPLLTCSDDE